MYLWSFRLMRWEQRKSMSLNLKKCSPDFHSLSWSGDGCHAWACGRCTLRFEWLCTFASIVKVVSMIDVRGQCLVNRNLHRHKSEGNLNTNMADWAKRSASGVCSDYQTGATSASNSWLWRRDVRCTWKVCPNANTFSWFTCRCRQIQVHNSTRCHLDYLRDMKTQNLTWWDLQHVSQILLDHSTCAKRAFFHILHMELWRWDAMQGLAWICYTAIQMLGMSCPYKSSIIFADGFFQFWWSLQTYVKRCENA